MPLARPRKRLALAADPTYLQVPPARARVPLRAASLRRSACLSMSGDFTPEQKRYLEGFTSGLQSRGSARGPAAAAPARAERARRRAHRGAGPRARGRQASSPTRRSSSASEHPFDAYARLQEQAAKNEFPKPADNFRWRYYGLFYVAPAQNSYMCRLRIPNGILKHWQFVGPRRSRRALRRRLFARHHARQFADPRDRAEERGRPAGGDRRISGLCSRGSGADNIRNVTGTPTAGIDPQELIDTRPYAREWHYHILNERALYGLPRKFNVAFDGAGRHRRCWRTPTTSASRRSR